MRFQTALSGSRYLKPTALPGGSNFKEYITSDMNANAAADGSIRASIPA